MLDFLSIPEDPPPFENASECLVCATTYSLSNRRHHCRNCGRSVCGVHGSNLVNAIEGRCQPRADRDKKRQTRVCDGCYNLMNFVVNKAGEKLRQDKKAPEVPKDILEWLFEP